MSRQQPDIQGQNKVYKLGKATETLAFYNSVFIRQKNKKSMEKELTELADEIEQLELALRQGELKSVLVSVNYGEKSHNITFGSPLDIGVSLSHYCRDRNKAWQAIIAISESLANIKES